MKNILFLLVIIPILTKGQFKSSQLETYQQYKTKSITDEKKYERPVYSQQYKILPDTYF